jgi:hypothetical protein
MDILQHPWSRCCPLFNTPHLNSCQLSTVAPLFQSLQYRTPLYCQPSTNWVSGWRPFHTIRLTFNWQMTIELSHTPTSYFTSFHSTDLHSAGLGSSLYSLGKDPIGNTVIQFPRAYSFPRERVYRASAQNGLHNPVFLLLLLSFGRYIATEIIYIVTT